MLYPTTTVAPLTAMAGPNLLPAGQLALIPIDMSVVRMTQLIALQVSLTEDFGLRGWVSTYPGGISLIAPLPDVFALSRVTPRKLIIFVPGQTPPADSLLAPVPPGECYFNILNLTNVASMFSFVKIDLA